MNRRDTIKSLLLGSVATGLALHGCAPKDVKESEAISNSVTGLYGRTPEEIEHDEEIFAEEFLNKHELSTIAVLCDIILPSNDTHGSATDAGVQDFIEFIVKDLPDHQTPLRGGLMWLDNYTNKTYGKEFVNCTNTEQLAVCDKIAYPTKKDEPSEFKQGEKFFTRMRNLTLTGYYTSKIGIEALGYVGNTPNVWDGVPQDILDKHGLSYDPVWLSKCVDQSKRGDIAKWDDEGNLIS